MCLQSALPRRLHGCCSRLLHIYSTADEGQLAQIPRAATRRTQDLDSRVMSAQTQCEARVCTQPCRPCNERRVAWVYSKCSDASSFAGQGRFTATRQGQLGIFGRVCKTLAHDCRALPARTCLWHERQMSASHLHCFRASGRAIDAFENMGKGTENGHGGRRRRSSLDCC